MAGPAATPESAKPCRASHSLHRKVGHGVHVSVNHVLATELDGTSSHFTMNVALDLGKDCLASFRPGVLEFNGSPFKRGLSKIIHENLQRLFSRNYGAWIHWLPSGRLAQRRRSPTRRQGRSPGTRAQSARSVQQELDRSMKSLIWPFQELKLGNQANAVAAAQTTITNVVLLVHLL